MRGARSACCRRDRESRVPDPACSPPHRELAQGTPDEHRLEAVKEREKNVAELTAEKARMSWRF